MLIVFAISITPTIVFHNWFADHIDSVKKTPGTGKAQVGKKLYNCHCDNIVAESPFTEPAKLIVAFAAFEFSKPKIEREVQFASSSPVFYSLRGPPVV